LYEVGKQVDEVYFRSPGCLYGRVMRDGKAIETAIFDAKASSVRFRSWPPHILGASHSHFHVCQSHSSIQMRRLDLKQPISILHPIQQVLSNRPDTAPVTRCITSRPVLPVAAKTHEPSDTILLTQEFLAEMLGVRRTSVTEVAVKIQEGGGVTYSAGDQDPDLDALRAIRRCYGL